jgi:hypothetical protein
LKKISEKPTSKNKRRATMSLSNSVSGLTTTVNDSQVDALPSPAGSEFEVFEDTNSDTCSEEDDWLHQEHIQKRQNDSERTDSERTDAATCDLEDEDNHALETRNSFQLQRSMEDHNTSFRLGRHRANPFAAIVPIVISPNGRAASLSSIPNLEEEEEATTTTTPSPEKVKEKVEETQPAFREFAHLSWNPHKLHLLNDEYTFCDDGPRELDAFLLDDVDFLDIYPKTSPNGSINPKALSKFCFPDGLRVRIIPRVCMPGAMRKGWAGIGGDRCHILVFTDGNGKTQHGVALTIKQEVPLGMDERMQLRNIVKNRRRRRMAAARISRWWQRRLQDRLLKKALTLVGCEQYSVENLRADLSASELLLLEQNMRNGASHKSGKKSGSFQWQSMMGKKSLSHRRKKPSSSESEHSQSVAEVTSLTRSAIQRSSIPAPPSEGDCASEITDDTDLTDPSADGSEKKRNRLFSLQKRDNSVRKVPTSPRASRGRPSGRYGSPPTSPRLPLSHIGSGRTSSTQSDSGRSVGSQVVVSEWARECGYESYQLMKRAAKYGNVCIVEQCYVLIGCRPDEHVLLLGPLQQLVNAERKEITDCRSRTRGGSMDEWVEEEKKILLEQRERRHHIMEAMLNMLRLTRGQSAVRFPRSNLEYICGTQHFFRANLPIPNAMPIKLPLPLPSIGKQWALAKLILDIGPDSLVLMLKLMLLERSILVLGENLEEVTPYACGLLELLEPFEWFGVFLPVLPHNLLDFVTSPVPFVAGMAVNDYTRVRQVENDKRTLDAMANGMSLLNLSTKTLHITSEAGISKMLSLDPCLREQLRCIRERLQHLSKNPSSSIHFFHRFIRTGFSPKESVVLDAACMALENHFSKYCGDLAISCTAWKQYGTMEVETGKFSFN